MYILIVFYGLNITNKIQKLKKKKENSPLHLNVSAPGRVFAMLCILLSADTLGSLNVC